MAPRHVVNLPSGPPLPQGQCRLFALPAELRNYVYELVLYVEPTSTGTILITNDALRSDDKRRKPTLVTMLGTCHLITEK